MTTLFYVLGIPITFLGILANLGTWKADVLFTLSGILIALRIIYYVIEKNQKRKEKNMELEKQRYDLDKIKNIHKN